MTRPLVRRSRSLLLATLAVLTGSLAAPVQAGSGLDLLGMAAAAVGSVRSGDGPGRKIRGGEASTYGDGDGFHGRTTANGERFDQWELTAAHRTLRFGTRVRVVRRSDGREVIVRINDRGPYAHGRVIDLSTAAAIQIGMRRGIADVDLYVLD